MMLSRRFLQPRLRHVHTTATARLCCSPRRAPSMGRFYSSGSGGETNKTSSSSPSRSSWTSRVLTPVAAGAAGLAVGLYYQNRSGSREKDPSGGESRDHNAVQISDGNSKTTTSTKTPTIIDAPDLNKLGLSDQIAYAPTPTSEDVTRQLNEGAWSCLPSDLKLRAAVTRYDGAQLGSNSPCEDAYVHGRFSSPFGGNGEWMAWAVFDGHCGWQMSNLLTRELVPSVRRALEDVAAKTGSASTDDDNGGVVSEDAIHGALKTAFTSLDDAVVKTAAATIESDMPFPEKARRLEAAYAGACALLALFDPATRTLRVASTGDCRAVLGSRRRKASSPAPSSPPSSSSTNPTATTTTDDDDNNNNNSSSSSSSSNWIATDLTTDHTGANPDEVARLRAQFPDEPSMVSGGRVWGMQPSRTFGDGMWKWTAALKRTLRQRYNGLSLPSAARYRDYKEGPYLTAEPAVATARIPDGGGGGGGGPEFLILATDGLWDTMTSQQAVDLVGRWRDLQQEIGKEKKKDNENEKKGKVEEKVEEKKGGFGPTILGWRQSCRYEESKMTVRDKNAAVHLIRNGLGGADEEMVRGALTFRYPNSRDIRDDITVQVVFFNNGPGEKGVGG